MRDGVVVEENLASARVLVVDDDPDGRTVLHAMLSRRGAAVTVCADGYQALERLRTDRFDAAVVDLMMPGAGGLDILRRARRMRGAPPIVIVTALGQGDLIDQAR